MNLNLTSLNDAKLQDTDDPTQCLLQWEFGDSGFPKFSRHLPREVADLILHWRDIHRADTEGSVYTLTYASLRVPEGVVLTTWNDSPTEEDIKEALSRRGFEKYTCELNKSWNVSTNLEGEHGDLAIHCT